MDIRLITVGKTDSAHVAALVEDYAARIRRFVPFDVAYLPDPRRTLPVERQKQLEAEALLRSLRAGDRVVLLDEHGAQYTSLQFAERLQRQLNASCKRLVFVVGGPYGFAPDVYARADARISLSPLTFSHQLVRPIFAEQLYRAFTILRGMPYHHE